MLTTIINILLRSTKTKRNTQYCSCQSDFLVSLYPKQLIYHENTRENITKYMIVNYVYSVCKLCILPRLTISPSLRLMIYHHIFWNVMSTQFTMLYIWILNNVNTPARRVNNVYIIYHRAHYSLVSVVWKNSRIGLRFIAIHHGLTGVAEPGRTVGSQASLRFPLGPSPTDINGFCGSYG